jgi:hypothetical protein
MIRSFRHVLAVATLAALAACSKGPSRPETAAPVLSPQAEIEAVVALLEKGQEDQAKKRLRAVLKRSPNDAPAQLLLDSIERDPKELLGPESYPYTVKPGETWTSLAERLLGNRLKFYQLARYNGLSAAIPLSPGQGVRIPGEPPRPPAPRPEPRKDTPAPAPSTPKPKPSAPKPAAPTQPIGNPSAARQARAAGLAALNQGKVAQAVALLRRAASLDPGNALIQRDLQRAQRIAATVRARK